MGALTERVGDDYLVRIEGFDTLRIRKVDLARDAETMQRWFNTDYARFWFLQNTSVEDIRRIYREKAESGKKDVRVGIRESTGELLFLFEVYCPVHFRIAEFYDAEPTDRGGHIFMAPPGEHKIENLTYFAYLASCLYIFSDPTVQRRIGAPDISHRKILSRYAQFGCNIVSVAYLDYHTVAITQLTRGDFEKITSSISTLKARRWTIGDEIFIRCHALAGRVITKLRSLTRRYLPALAPTPDDRPIF